MFIRIFGLLALAISLFGTQCWASICTPPLDESPGLTCTFTPGPNGNKEGIYDFGVDGRLVVDFVTVLRQFDLTVTVDHLIDGLAEGVFPAGTACVKYSTNGGRCAEYDFTGNVFSHPPHFVPVQNRDYRGLITLTLSYYNSETVHSPAFLHAPGASTVFTEDILTSYSAYPPCPPTVEGLNCNNSSGDPTMGGKSPNLSTVAAFDEPGANDCFVWISPTDGQTFQAGQEIEVEFQLFDNTGCTGKPERDKDARLSLSRVDNLQLTVVPLGKDEGGNHFHFDNEEGVNEREVDTEGLLPGVYIITVVSDEFTQQTRTVCISSCP